MRTYKTGKVTSIICVISQILLSVYLLLYFYCLIPLTPGSVRLLFAIAYLLYFVFITFNIANDMTDVVFTKCTKEMWYECKEYK